MYSKELIDHFKKPHNQGVIKDADAVGQVGNIKCGDIMKLYLKFNKQDKTTIHDFIIADVKFETLGCAAAIASTSVLTDLIKGKTVRDALQVTNEDIVEVLNKVPPVKVHCSFLAVEALKKAVDNYKN